MESLSQCPLVHSIFTYDCGIRDPSIAATDEIRRTDSLLFGGRTRFRVCTQLRTLYLLDVEVYPQFVSQLAQCLQLSDMELRVVSVSSDPDIAEVDWYEINAIAPLPGLRRLRIDLGPERGALPLYSLLTPAAQYLVSAAAQLAGDMPSGDIRLQPAPLQAADVARLLLNPDRPFSNVEIMFSLLEDNQEALDIWLTADVATVSPPGVRKPSFALVAGIRRTELAALADVILERFPLESDIKKVWVDKTTLAAIQMASEGNPDAAGLQYLLRRTKKSTRNSSRR